MFDKRLWGIWQSDAEMTFRQYKRNPGVSLKNHRKFQALFGKLVVRYGRTKYHWHFNDSDGQITSERYAVVAKDANSVVIRHSDAIMGDDLLTQIHFEGDYYWFALPGGRINEWFRKIQ